MFGKNSKKLETIIGVESEFRGELNVKGTVRIDGFVEGDIRADWVVVGEAGKIKGNIVSRGTVVGGRVEGNIDADEIAELKHGSYVAGEIRSGKLAVSEGAVFVGHSLMKAGNESPDVADRKVIKLNSPATSS